ncbi:MAG: hypothetical protein U0V70_12240 [Terriglobia bacterium]
MLTLRRAILFLLLTWLSRDLRAQDASYGITMPVTITGQFLQTQRPRHEEPDASTVSGAFRAVVYPSLKLGPHWFIFSAWQVNSTPFFYHDAYEPEHEVETHTLQAFLGYTHNSEKVNFTWKTGHLPTAFGAFPLRYDDNANPLLDLPLSNGSYLKLRPDQLPCGSREFYYQDGYPQDVDFHCGGAEAESYGMAPATLYGLPGTEIDFSMKRFDARFQLTNSSPANPQNLLSSNQHVQWTVGSGYTIQQGFRVGFSAFRGPYLEKTVRPWLPMGVDVADFPATAIGVDVEWARGRWSILGEWQRFQFNYPLFTTSPAAAYGYVETKTIINPRFYAAMRLGYENHNQVADITHQAIPPSAKSPVLRICRRLPAQSDAAIESRL